jgi:hypothetical protein
MFGVPITLLIKRNQTYNTMIGSTLSLFIYGLCMYSFMLLSYDMLSRSSPTVVSKVEYTPNPEVWSNFHPRDILLVQGDFSLP